MGIQGDDNPQFHYSLFSNRMRFPAVTGGLFCPRIFPLAPCKRKQRRNAVNRWWSERPVHTGHRIPRGLHTGTTVIPTPRCPLNILLNEALIPAWYIPRLPDKSLTKLPSLFTFTRLSSTNSLRTAAFSQVQFPYRSPDACCSSALRPVHDIYCGYRLISIPCIG